MQLIEYQRVPLIIDTGRTTKRIKRQMKGKPDVWYLTFASSEPYQYGNACPYVLEFVRSCDAAVCFWLGSHDLDALIEECRARGLRGERRVV